MPNKYKYDWQLIEKFPPPKDRPILFGGRWRPFDISPGRTWACEKFRWSTLMSNGTGHQWFGPNFTATDHWNVDWTHWTDLPDEPKE